MTKIERTPQQLILKSGSTTLTIDKGAGKVTHQHKVLLWSRKPLEHPLSEVADVAVDAALDRASGVEICNTMLIMRGGLGLSVPAADKKDATATAAAVRDFLGMGQP